MDIKDAVHALAALSQETRLSVFRLLVEAAPEGMTAGRIGESLDVPPTTLSFHLKELLHAGMLSSRQAGRFIHYSADFERMAALMGFLTQNCCQGMPQKCRTVMETALRACASSQPKHRSARSRA